MSDPMDDLAAKIARMLAQTDGQPRVMPHNQDDARAVLDVIKEAGFAIVATRTYEPERLIDNLRENANRQHERICALVREREALELAINRLRYAGAHQIWCGMFGETVGWDDELIRAIEHVREARAALAKETQK